MHTIGNKLVGFTLFLLLPVWIFSYKSIDWSLIAAGVMASLSALEETAILLNSKSYDANRRSIVAVEKG